MFDPGGKTERGLPRAGVEALLHGHLEEIQAFHSMNVGIMTQCGKLRTSSPNKIGLPSPQPISSDKRTHFHLLPLHFLDFPGGTEDAAGGGKRD